MENEQQTIKGRDILIYLSLKYDGDWDKIYETIQNREKLDFSDADEVLSRLNSNAVTILDKEYPRQFANIFKPPFVLYYKGDISLLSNPNTCLSVIGSRSNTSYGEKMTKELIAPISNKLVVVSGMSRGIDTIAHNTAIQNGGKTVAILGCGINYCYPKSNEELYKTLCENDLVISEYPNDVAPQPTNFIDRNRLIAAASSKTLVVEAKYKSGAVSTINYALQYGRDILCVPTRADEESMCNRLIKEGAPVVENVEDIMIEYQNIF